MDKSFCVAVNAGAEACVIPDTLVILTDDSRKRIDEVTHEDQLLVWDFYKGEYTFEGILALFDEYLNR